MRFCDLALKSTPHAHTSYVDGRDTVDEMAAAALKKGFHSLGFSEHGEQPFDRAYGLTPEKRAAYRADVLRAREQYRGKLRIWLGVERDAHSTEERTDYDYAIGSCHYLPCGDGYVAVDGAPEGVDRLVRETFGGDGTAMAAAYFAQLGDYAVAYRPQIIGHFDLVRKRNGAGRYFDPRGPRYLAAAYAALERAAESGAFLEVNTGAIARGVLSTPYPDEPLLRRWRALGGRAILSSDCHDAEKLDCGFDQSLALLQACGYQSVWALGAGEALFEEVPLV